MDVKFPDWHYPAMSEIPKTILQLRLAERLASTGQKPSPLAIKIGQSDSFVRDILRGKTKSPAADAFERLAAALETTTDYLHGKTDDPSPDEANAVRTVPIVGYAGAGPDGSVLFAEGQGNYGEATAPIDASDSTEALEVRGDSMRGLASDGWLIFYDDKKLPGPEHMGEPCVCWLASGRVLIKEPQPGTAPGLFHLTSVNAKTMTDIAVDAMAVVTDIKTRAAAKKYIRRHPEMPIVDVVVDA